MKLFSWGKDGGKESSVWGFWFIEAKSLFSVALLKFVGKSREAYHTHAFNSISWVLKGKLIERVKIGQTDLVFTHRPSWHPVLTSYDTLHMVDSEGTTWALTFRGPWREKWFEFIDNRWVTLTHGRKVVSGS